jgi:hypothetical protein
MNKIFIILIFCIVFLNANIIDMFYLNKAKNKINYLNKKTKFILQSSENGFLNASNILTLRNSKLVDIVSNDTLSAREINILNVIDKISLDTKYITNSFGCNEITTHSFSTNGLYIQPSISNVECENINFKFTNFYELGVFSIKDINGTILNTYKNKIKFDNIENNIYLSNNIKKITLNKKLLEYKINFLLEDELLLISQKISRPTNYTFIDYTSLAKQILQRADVLDPTGTNSILNTTRTNANAYIFNKYPSGFSNSSLYNINLNDEINNRIVGLTNDNVTITSDISILTLDISTLQGNEPPDLNYPPYSTMHATWENDLNNKLTELQSKNNKLIQNNNLLNTYNNYASGAVVIPDTFSSKLSQLLRIRISENIIYEKIKKIYILQKYINKYILKNAKKPNFLSDLGIDFLSMGVVGSVWRPKMFDNVNQNINFDVDLDKSIVIFDNIFSTAFINSIDEFSLDIKKNFKKNISLKSDAIIDDSSNSYKLILPLNLKTVKFYADIKNSNLLANGTNAFEKLFGMRSDIACLLGGNSYKDTLYEPNENGGFKLYYCNGTNWEDIRSIEKYDINNTITQYRNNNINYGIMANNNIAGEIFYQDINTTHVKKVIGIGGNFMRITK